MNLVSNNSHTDINNINNNIIENKLQIGQINQINQMKNDIKFDSYKLKKDSIEYLINKEDNIFYYLIRCKNYDEIKKSLESNIIQLPKEIYNEYKDKDIKNNKLTVIIFLFDDECENFAGFAQLKYPLPKNNSDEEKENESKNGCNYYKIEWLWRTKLHYSKVGHLMNRADNDHFLNEGKNGCPIDKDLGNYCCRLMIKRLSKDEVKELINEKTIFENQKNALKNLKKEKPTNFHNNYYHYDNKYKKFDYSEKKNNNKYHQKSPYNYSNNKSYTNDKNSNKYYSNNKKDFKYTGHKKYRNNSKSRSHNEKSDSEDYSSPYKKNKIKKIDDNSNYKSEYKFHPRKDFKDYSNYHRYSNNDDNKSTDFSSKKSYH
jgi:hypothetical protein